jgi:hypothetical protein
MRRNPVALAVLALLLPLVSFARPSAANPDGPVGSLSVTPTFSFNNRPDLFEFGYHPADPSLGIPAYLGPTGSPGHRWAAGVDVLIPVWTHATVGVGFQSLHVPGTTGRVVPTIPQDQEFSYLEGFDSFSINLSVRFFIPLTGEAKEALSRGR